MTDMSPAPGAAAEDSKTAGRLLGPDPPLPCTFAFHPLHTCLIPSIVFPFTSCTASTPGILTIWAFHKCNKALTIKMRLQHTLFHQMKLQREACWTAIIPITGRCICLIPLSAAAGTPRKALHSLKSTLSQDIIAQQLSVETPAGCVPCQHSVDTVTAQQMRIAGVHVSY